MRLVYIEAAAGAGRKGFVFYFFLNTISRVFGWIYSSVDGTLPGRVTRVTPPHSNPGPNYRGRCGFVVLVCHLGAFCEGCKWSDT